MIRGWCPTAHDPMPSGDGLLLRVKPFGGMLSAAQLAVLADAAERHGNGIVELTGRGNLQLRGIHAPAACTALLLEAGLADPDPARESRRNVITLPGADPALVAAIEAILSEIPNLAPKFCVAVGAAEADAAVVDGALLTATGTQPFTPDALRGVLHRAAGGRLPLVRPAAGPRPPGLLFLPFGQTDAGSLRSLPAVHTTPWRAFLPLAPAGEAALAAFVSDPADPRLAVAACPGGPACASGSVPARLDAALLARLGRTELHVSGCAKGCARPRRTATTLVGRDGRYDLVRNGRAGDPPELRGLTLAQAAAVLYGPLPFPPTQAEL